MMHFAHVLSREAYQSYWMNHTTVPDEDLCGLHLRKDTNNCDELCFCLYIYDHSPPFSQLVELKRKASLPHKT